mmetsp:Transcript_18970/g.44194  ORF Transcript_18970/g.44194 Transcript_18970/m.44194 type:complete len:213 (+) Transcript_18970:141-779(+)|eukprot:CAMPEP_0178453930 /NCGR_PEP_ID=MMETSP0689_2-20121128/45075_1 /TAXON_ID=160604 /ORGANISM="Amphidinium massartii, Strain CS-259" /LENGTH=212 /DNA_ID=CAMNT_0020079805 /DNA_START=45 /DNA_END=683 /DNA_ORIENTATION=-
MATIADVAKDWDDMAGEWTSGEHSGSVMEFNRRAEELFRAKVTNLADKDVLEFGAGHGVLGMALAPDCRSVHLIDVAPKMIEEAKKKIAEKGLPNVQASCCDIMADCPFTEASFDAIVSGSVLTFAPDLPGTLAKLAAGTRTGGIALHILFKSDEAKAEVRPRGRADALSYNDGMTEAQLKDEMEASGFAALEFGEIAVDGCTWMWGLFRKS